MRADAVRLLASSLAVLFSLSGTATAGDGVIEINQARALQGGVTSGDNPGFPIEIFASGSYRLTGDLAVPPGAPAGLFVYASGTHLDLNGFTISSTTSCSGQPLVCAPVGTGIGIDASGANGVSVRNGRVTGFGVYALFFAEGSRAEGIIVESNGAGGIVTDRGCTVSGNTLRGNGGRGIVVGSGSRVTSNVVDLSGGTGITAASPALIEDNVVTRSGGASMAGGGAIASNVCDDGTCTEHPRPRFYLSSNSVDGAHAFSACAPGFHMASVSELLQPGSLDYDSQLGFPAFDGSRGMPPATPGWIRPGGAGNLAQSCQNWTSVNANLKGAMLRLDLPDSAVGTQYFGSLIEYFVANCNGNARVWCRQN